jgi:NIMA (never in mitosis gene a)-related kinase
LNEVRILASINHPNVIGYKEAFFDDHTNCLYIIMEHADGGDLLKLINERKKIDPFNEN